MSLLTLQDLAGKTERATPRLFMNPCSFLQTTSPRGQSHSWQNTVPALPLITLSRAERIEKRQKEYAAKRRQRW